MFSPIQQNKAFLQIAMQIRNKIEEGQFQDGDRLPPERSLAESFGTSRATVREALRALEIIGLIDSRVGQGTFIKISSISEIDKLISEIETQTSPLEVFEARIALEPYLGKLAALNANQEDITFLEKCLSEMKNNQDKFTEFEHWDGQFHQGIAQAAKNSLLIKFTTLINNVRMETLWGSIKKRSLTPERINIYHQEHQLILNSIKERNSSLAAEMVKKHILTVKRNFFEDEDLY
ncbi:FadR/GntR family transcriptional regulator [Bacillus sp. ISL-45]|uniref:FadR/GntR family transcriptional regulator n=1 Tax=Bacillus sp. ISL-45 TaxID=2819128 RepID=UPI001BECFB9D|nr:FadR/GntR family transcriptional regulator [Bacillus sp. ISL-45]MBT2661646.1 FadR family transcriptional regulator [Bacillus sp. ISL-45]